MKSGTKTATIKNLKHDYEKEYNFIKDLLNRGNLPSQGSDSSDSEENPKANLKDGTVPTERAKSLEELHKRLAALREQKYTYKGKKLKNKLQSKLRRKNKVQENKSKRNVLSKENVLDSSHTETKIIDTKPPKPMFNSNGNVVFSKFDFLGETASVSDKKLLTKQKGTKKQLLEKLQKDQQFIKKLEETGDVEKANQIKDETKWKNVLQKAEGIKVKDDPALLKKTLAKKQAKKKASESKWKERLKSVEKQKHDKQKKRKENIDKKLQEKKKKKMKKAVKKGRYVPNA